jgi:hypothetical protein
MAETPSPELVRIEPGVHYGQCHNYGDGSRSIATTDYPG